MMVHRGEGAGGDALHVLDLPQLFSRPTPKSLLDALNRLALKPASWDGLEEKVTAPVDPPGLARYLTSIIASDLSWIGDDGTKEKVWELASARLSERAGRTARGELSRTFTIPTTGGNEINIALREPALTADNLGLKTWASAYLLAKRLHTIILPALPRPGPRRVLELGAGTGLVGIAAVAVWGASAHLTDMREIVDNLRWNVAANTGIVTDPEVGGTASCGMIDWRHDVEAETDDARYDVILAADPLYSPQHPQLLVQTIGRWISPEASARVIVELPLREAYLPEIADFKMRMAQMGFEVLSEGEEVGYDDWGGGGDGGLEEVRCWWGLWAWLKDT